MIYEALGIAIAVLAAIYLPLLDRMRGSDTGIINRNICKLLMAVAVFAMLFSDKLFTVEGSMFLLFVPAYLVGASIGWGAPVGGGLREMTEDQYRALVADDRQRRLLEWYVRGKLEGSWLSSLFVRGLLWGVFPAAILALFGHLPEALLLLLVYTAAMPAGVLLANQAEGTVFDDYLNRVSMTVTKEADKWGNQEILRGIFVSLALIIPVICLKIVGL